MIHRYDPSFQMDLSQESGCFTRLTTDNVVIGTDPDRLDQLIVEKELASFYETLLLHWKQYHSPYYHHMLVENLEPDTFYFYQCLIQPDETSLRGETNKWSPESIPFKEKVEQ